MPVTHGHTAPLVRLRQPHTGEQQQTRWRLIACPPSGAGAAFYQPWSGSEAARDCELYSVRYPGRESRFGQPFADSVSALADEVAAAVVDLLRSEAPLPTVVLGHSMGASVAAETVSRVEAELPGAVSLLVLSAKEDPRSRRSAGSDRSNEATTEGASKPAGLRRLFGRKKTDAPAQAQPPPARPTERTVEEITATDASLTAWMREVGGTPEALLDDPDFMAMQLPIMRSDLRMSHRHDSIPEPFDVPVLLLAAAEDPVTTAESMRGWSEVTSGVVTERVVPGGHHGLLEPEADVLGVIGRVL